LRKETRKERLMASRKERLMASRKAYRKERLMASRKERLMASRKAYRKERLMASRKAYRKERLMASRKERLMASRMAYRKERLMASRKALLTLMVILRVVETELQKVSSTKMVPPKLKGSMLGRRYHKFHPESMHHPRFLLQVLVHMQLGYTILCMGKVCT